jgi:hypothetical protein
MFKDSEVILNKKLPLYDNLAVMDEHEGRLRAELQVDPYPVLRWNFESLGRGWRVSDKGMFRGSISGYQFFLEDGLASLSRVFGSLDRTHGYTYAGSASRAWIGSRGIVPEHITFYIPNARCFVLASEGSLNSDTYQVVYRPDQKPELNKLLPTKSSVGESWEIQVTDDLWIELGLAEEARVWLNPNNKNHGTYLTLRGSLHRNRNLKSRRRSRSEFTSIDEPLQYLERLCWMLSFANGGYLGPLLVKAESFPPTPDELVVVSAYSTTPLELLGLSWASVESDLEKYTKCFPVFERMISGEPWKSMYELALIWYFQAIQPGSGQALGKPWPVVANALGAVLERLSVTILTDEYGERTGKDRIGKLLEKIGVLDAHDDRKYVPIFSEVRNDATHSRKTGKYSDDELHLSLQYAKLWVEEVLLWRLGYDGGYRRRIPGSNRYSFENPRYDLSTRLPTW